MAPVRPNVATLRRAGLAAALPLLLLACGGGGPAPGEYEQVFEPGNPLALAGRSTLSIERGGRFVYRTPMMSMSGEYRRSGDSLYFETVGTTARVVVLQGEAVGDTLLLEQPQLSAIRRQIGPGLVVGRFVRRR
jgi:hypothetical protein